MSLSDFCRKGTDQSFDDDGDMMMTTTTTTTMMMTTTTKKTTTTTDDNDDDNDELQSPVNHCSNFDSRYAISIYDKLIKHGKHEF